MRDESIRSHFFTFGNDPKKVFDEIKYIISQLRNNFKNDFLEQVFWDTESLFHGKFKGFRSSNTKYHNLDHTISVALATARLIHGGYIEGHNFSPKNIVLTIAAALFHDTGLIQSDDDVEGSGAKYTIGHEERSIDFMKGYLSRADFSSNDLDNCSQLIRCTDLSLSPREIPFESEEIENLGKIIGTADLLAQMADRVYLEKLLLLYKEFEEARLPEFDSELDLLKKTEDFFEYVAKKRLSDELGGVSAFMKSHFRVRWDMDEDLYTISILKNIQYLKSLKMECEDSLKCYLDNLKRGGIVKKFNEQLKS